MFKRTRYPLMMLATAALLSSCGGARMQPPPTVTGILVRPSDTTAYSAAAPPQNQAAFVAYETFSDGSVGVSPISNAQWTYDSAYWVSLNGSVATCTQPAPMVIFTLTSTITATAKVSGTTYTTTALLTCL
jgi:hypothetical protein